MKFIKGQAILGKIRFPDGKMPEYDRPYLIIRAEDEYIEVLNVSSVKGKEHKLSFPYNEFLRRYNPPFLYPSFVKLDSLTKVKKANWNDFRVLCCGKTLAERELDRIIKLAYSAH